MPFALFVCLDIIKNIDILGQFGCIQWYIVGETEPVPGSLFFIKDLMVIELLLVTQRIHRLDKGLMVAVLGNNDEVPPVALDQLNRGIVGKKPIQENDEF